MNILDTLKSGKKHYPTILKAIPTIAFETKGKTKSIEQIITESGELKANVEKVLEKLIAKKAVKKYEDDTYAYTKLNTPEDFMKLRF